MAAKYLQILSVLSQRVDSMQPGDALPGEEELAREFEVSPMTVRRALTILIDSKRIVGIRGRGTFVTQQPLMRTLSLSSFSETMQAGGRMSRSEVLAVSMDAADAARAGLLGLDEGTPVYSIRRLRFGDDTPVGIDRTLLPAARFPGLLGLDLSGSLYALLRDRYGVEVRRATSDISAIIPEADDRDRLRLNAGAPCLAVRATATDAAGSVVEVTDSIYRADLYTLRVEHSTDDPS